MHKFTNLLFGLLSAHPITPLISLLQEVQNNAKKLDSIATWIIYYTFLTLRYPNGSHVVGAFIMPCDNCFFCSITSMVISLWDATLYLVQFSTIIFNAIRTTLINVVKISFIFEEKLCNTKLFSFFFFGNWVKGEYELCDDFYAYNRPKGTLFYGETRLFLRGSGNYYAFNVLLLLFMENNILN